MDQKSEIERALSELAERAQLSLPAVDGANMGPLGLTKALLKGLPRAQLVALPGFAGTWLDMIVRETQELLVDGVAILPGLLPPASMLRLVNGTADESAILAAGATVSVRPPNNELLVLSPARADAAVYVLENGGLRKLAGSVAELVVSEVRAILDASARLPRFGFDTGEDLENWAVIVAGRIVDEPPTQSAVKRLEALVRRWAERTSLPLAYVHLGTTVNWVDEDDESPSYESAPGIIGLVIEHASGKGPVKIDRGVIDPSALARIPAALFEELEALGTTAHDEGVYLAAAGWTVASIYDGAAPYDAGLGYFGDEKHLVSACAEDGRPAKRLDDRELPASLWLYATYA